jgi:prefoldin subunit 5
LEKTMERHSKQIQQIEEEIPPMETQMTSFDGQIDRLQNEIGVSKRIHLFVRTFLHHSLTHGTY